MILVSELLGNDRFNFIILEMAYGFNILNMYARNRSSRWGEHGRNGGQQEEALHAPVNVLVRHEHDPYIIHFNELFLD